jgi:L-ribulose-5-phosphate 3-epimerase
VDVVAVSTNSYHTYGLDAALDGIAEAGFRDVEISAVRGWTEHLSLDADDAELAAFREGLRRRGLRLSALSGHSDLTTDEGVELGLRALELCSRLRVPILNTAVGGHASRAEDLDAFLARIDHLASAAAGRGVTVALEVHGEVMATGRQARALVERVGRENVRINYDTGNSVFYGGVDPTEDVAGLAGYLAHCHLKDKRGGRGVWDFPALGDGEIDLGSVVRTLRAEGFRGPWSVELEFQGEPWPSVEAVGAALRRSRATLGAIGLV